MTKRIVSLLMAMMLAIGVFAVPALAAQEDDGIMPHGPMCYCGGTCTISTSDYWRPEGNKSCIHKAQAMTRSPGELLSQKQPAENAVMCALRRGKLLKPVGFATVIHKGFMHFAFPIK